MAETLPPNLTSYPSYVPMVPPLRTHSEKGETPPSPIACTKVLHIINGEHFSGAERVQQGLGKRLDEFGFKADFLCLKSGKFTENCDLPPNRVFEFPMNSRRDFSVVPRITQFVLDGHYQVLHAHTPRSAMVTAMVAKRTATPWAYHVHSPTSRDSTRRWLNCLNAWTERLALFSCHHLITVSDSLNAEMVRKGWKPERVTTIHNGVEPLPAIDWHARLPQSPWKLGMVALMRPRKGVEMLLEALYILSARRQDIRLELIGSFETANYQSQIEKLVHKWHLDKYLHFSGFTRDVPGKLSGLDALVLPSLFGEGLPMVVLEAMAAGVPVVATSVEGTPEAVRDGIDGLLALPRNAGDLAAKIDQLCADRQSWQTMGMAARERQQNQFTTRKMAENIANVYTALLPKSYRRQ
jgi:glycosyltransferase involved in cell wall biosynthesis